MSRLRPLHWVALAFAVPIVLLGLFALWLANSASGARWLVNRSDSMLPGLLTIETVQGKLAGPLTLGNLSYRDEDSGIDVSVERVQVDLALLALLRATVRIESAEIVGLQLTLTDPSEPQPDPQQFSLDPPIDLVIETLAIRDASVRRNGDALADIRTARVKGAWTSAQLAIRELTVDAAQGALQLTGKLAGDEPYIGETQGHFRWQLGQRTVAGTFTSEAIQSQVIGQLSLTQPVTANLRVTLQQQADLPWEFTLDVPRHDPREWLVSESSALVALATQLTGGGTSTSAHASGVVVINDERLRLEQLRLAPANQATAIDGLIQWGDGKLTIAGAIRGDVEPLSVDLDVAWRDLKIPADIAGQILETAGAVSVNGSPQQYAIDGKLALGPPKRLADMQIKLTGSTDALELERLVIVQRDGRLSAAGRVAWHPEVNWQIDATARGFDPGALWVRWPGALDFTLATKGQVAAEQITGSLDIDQLRGKLRGAPVRGSADLALDADRVLTGSLALQANNSRLRVTSKRIEPTAMEAVADLSVPSLADWLVDAAGKFSSKFTIRGRWPSLNIQGDVAANSIRVGKQSADTLTASIALTDPLQPDGKLTVVAQDLSLAGFEFSGLDLRLSGNAARHLLTLDVEGPEQSAALSLQGGMQESVWQASVSRLQVAATDLATFSLQEPVQVMYSDDQASLSRTCLIDGEMRICLAGSRQNSGTWQAKYELAKLPLMLTQRVFADPLPVAFDGLIDGEGQLLRDPSGLFTGTAELRSAAGALLQSSVADQTGAPLIRYSDLALRLALVERSATLTLSAVLDDSGAVEGHITANDLDTERTTLAGTFNARLPSLAVIEVLTPQLVDVSGNAMLQASIAGTLQQPELSGQLEISGFTAEVPRLGLTLRDGSLNVTPQPEGPFKIAGRVRSGDGVLLLGGTATLAGDINFSIKGQDVLAADFPGVRAVATPDLVFQRSDEQMSLVGYVRLPSADINLARLPRGTRPQSASDDVVVVDDTDRTVDDARGSPLAATIRIEFGEQVKIAGYGLDATVAGTLMVRERPGEPTTGSGEVRVSGTYKAYGQDLKIRQGQLLYAGSPLDNPRLTIVAVREVGTVTAGIRVAGNAKSPLLSVFSDPAMGQANALSYLVAGKPMDQIGAGEGDAMTAAARSLGTAAGGLLAKNIGKRLGVDEVGISDSEMIGGAALTVGQYLSPRLYLSYGVGLFEPGEVLTLRYKISDELALKVEQGAERSRGGLEYRIEK